MTENNSIADQVLAEVTRSGVVESFHTGHLVLLGANGEIVFSKGNPALRIFPRSSIKSIQTSAMVRHGLKLPPKLLALVSASHSGSAMHQEVALEILKAAGLDQTHLKNGKDRPLGVRERREWAMKAPTTLAHNCSGKHAGMLNTSVVNKWPVDTYLDPTHPVQVACRQELELLAHEEVELTSIDGCGAPLFLISLLGLARAIHNITISQDPIHMEVVKACLDNPEMVAGQDRLTTKLMMRVPGLFMKEGAEGVLIGSMPDGRTLAFKVSDGSSRAHQTIVNAALEMLKVTVVPEESPIYGGSHVVGSIRATL
jgi:L-asparaginase II